MATINKGPAVSKKRHFDLAKKSDLSMTRRGVRGWEKNTCTPFFLPLPYSNSDWTTCFDQEMKIFIRDKIYMKKGRFSSSYLNGIPVKIAQSSK